MQMSLENKSRGVRWGGARVMMADGIRGAAYEAKY